MHSSDLRTIKKDCEFALLGLKGLRGSPSESYYNIDIFAK